MVGCDVNTPWQTLRARCIGQSVNSGRTETERRPGSPGQKRWQACTRGAVVLTAGLALAGCAQKVPAPKRLSKSGSGGMSLYDPKTGVSASPRLLTRHQPIPKGGGVYKIGTPYKVAGRWYVPKLDPDYNRTGIASWYGDAFHGRKTANGEIYDMNALTAAHPTMPLPSYALVTNLKNGRKVLVRVNDRGPYARERIIDLSRAAATALGFRGHGLARVRVRYAGRAPLNGSDHRERRFLARQPWAKGRGLAAASGTFDPPRRQHRPVHKSLVRLARRSGRARVPGRHWQPRIQRPYFLQQRF